MIISENSANILQELEKLTKTQFTKVNEVKYTTKMGFTAENQRITGIGLFDCGLSTLKILILV